MGVGEFVCESWTVHGFVFPCMMKLISRVMSLMGLKWAIPYKSDSMDSS